MRSDDGLTGKNFGVTYRESLLMILPLIVSVSVPHERRATLSPGQSSNDNRIVFPIIRDLA
jgi:hypothetical protein